MSDKLDDFVSQLQERIYEETRTALGEKGFERWLNPRYRGDIDNPDGYARITDACGDTMQIFLKFENENVTETTFQTDGCESSAVCGSLAAELALGKSPDELVEITGETILRLLGNLPEEGHHCAYLAAKTLRAALSSYMRKWIHKKEAHVRWRFPARAHFPATHNP
jgi:nitrogen fixation NifU-like protein